MGGPEKLIFFLPGLSTAMLFMKAACIYIYILYHIGDMQFCSYSLRRCAIFALFRGEYRKFGSRGSKRNVKRNKAKQS